MKPQPVFVHHNRKAMALWCIAAFWMCGVVAMHWLLWRDGLPKAPHPAATVALAGLFWVGTVLLLLRYVLSRLVLSVAVEADGSVEIVQRFPHRAVHGRFAPGRVDRPHLIEDCDIDGDPYHVCRLFPGPPFATPVHLAEGAKAHCLQVAAQFEDATGQAVGTRS